ncbi:hypothetical protein SSX86_018884 [Deinandra increscens subsp. villosa]|uniref:Uncharacterized protein n=1 Tax=Deinandra increscens subsp. villosa TaxID=3103831 RepID=A0AAP0CT62_9ASTR
MYPGLSTQRILNLWSSLQHNIAMSSPNGTKIWATKNPRGAERLPPGVVEPESDFYLHRLWGNPTEDLDIKPKYLVTFAVGYEQKEIINKAVKKVWWYAKRFLHPDIVAPYDYIFIWDEDLGLDDFDAEKYIELIKKHGLEISQPGLSENSGHLSWQMTRKQNDTEVHKLAKERESWCIHPHLPPCAAFVEIMAPVFSRKAWRCVWNMIQNDLVHGWGLDFALRRCVEHAHEKIGVVDAQPIVHQTLPSLGNHGTSDNGKPPREAIRQRCKKEWIMFHVRMRLADRAYFKHREMASNQTNTTHQ